MEEPPVFWRSSRTPVTSNCARQSLRKHPMRSDSMEYRSPNRAAMRPSVLEFARRAGTSPSGKQRIRPSMASASMGMTMHGKISARILTRNGINSDQPAPDDKRDEQNSRKNDEGSLTGSRQIPIHGTLPHRIDKNFSFSFCTGHIAHIDYLVWIAGPPPG